MDSSFSTADTLNPELLVATLNLVLKHEDDIEKARGQLAQFVPV